MSIENQSNEKLRLQKFIADCGVTSRRKAEELILQGRVRVNGDKITQLGAKVDITEDVVEVDGKILSREVVDKVYILLNKPRGIMTTVHDPEGRQTVMDIIPKLKQRVYPVGRLDYHSEGLLLLTNDGEMANKIMHPSSEVVKVYEVKVFGAVTPKILSLLREKRQVFERDANGRVRKAWVRPKSVRVVKQLPNKTWLEFRLNEGRNREIRKICDAVGLTIDKLKRVAIAALNIDGLAPGKFQFLTKDELVKALGMTNLDVRFVSSKRTLDLNKKGHQDTKRANDNYFKKYRKHRYLKTLGARTFAD